MKKSWYKKGLVLGVILLFVGAGIIPSIGGNIVERYSSKDNRITFNGFNSNDNILYVGGSGPGNYTTIQDAIDNASNGDTIFVYDDSSPYYENVEVDKSINLIGENRETTVIDGNNVYLAVEISFKWVNISGFTIRNSGIDGSGILLYGFCNFSHNIVTLNNGCGILIFGGFFGNFGYCNIISDNIITYNKHDGISLRGAEANAITNNTISNNGNGIYASGSLSGKTSDNIISGNNITSNNDYGIELIGDCFYNIIFHNNFINNIENAYGDCDNIWDDGKYGNYWSDYKEKYPFACKIFSKGIWNTPYEIEGGGNKDNFPLINQYPKSVIKSKSVDKPFYYNFPLLNWLFELFPNTLPILKYIMGLS